MNQCYAIVPAAGSSRRMGKPKLLLPWQASSLGTRASSPSTPTTVIDQVLHAWTSSRVARTVVVIRNGDIPLREACRRHAVHIVEPEITPIDMKASCCVGLQFIQQQFRPDSSDRCFIAPADLPELNNAVIDCLIASESLPAEVVVPKFGTRIGHPILMPWPLTREIFELDIAEGVDAIVARHPKRCICFPPEELVADIDTPEEYEHALNRTTARRSDAHGTNIRYT